MNNVCGNHSPYSTHTCERSRNHGGPHETYNRQGAVRAEWEEVPKKKPFKVEFIRDEDLKDAAELREAMFNSAFGLRQACNRLEELNKDTEHSVLLTLEDLKTIAYYLPEYSGEADDPDDVTKAKIDKALKEAL